MGQALPLRAIGDRQRESSLLSGKTVTEAIDLWGLMGLTAFQPKSKRKYLCRLHVIREVIGVRPVSELSEADADRVQITVESLDCSKEWKYSIRVGWFSFVKWLLTRHALVEDLRDYWPPIKVRQADWVRSHADFSREEITRLCEYLSSPFSLYVWFSCLTGQRASNVRTCEWSEIGEDHVWTIPAWKFKQGRALELPVCPALWAMLPPRGKPPDLVIQGLPGEERIRLNLKAAAEKAGLNPADAIPHNFRRTCCRWLAEAGVTRDQVQDLMGWADTETLLNNYWRKAPPIAEKWRIADKL